MRQIGSSSSLRHHNRRPSRRSHRLGIAPTRRQSVGNPFPAPQPNSSRGCSNGGAQEDRSEPARPEPASEAGGKAYPVQRDIPEVDRDEAVRVAHDCGSATGGSAAILVWRRSVRLDLSQATPAFPGLTKDQGGLGWMWRPSREEPIPGGRPDLPNIDIPASGRPRHPGRHRGVGLRRRGRRRPRLRPGSDRELLCHEMLMSWPPLRGPFYAAERASEPANWKICKGSL